MLFCRHKGGDRGSRRRRQARRLVGGTTWNFSQRLPWWFEATLTTRLWWLKRVCGSIFGFLMGRCAVLGRRSIWAVLRLVAAWQFGTGVLWASVACFVNCTLIRQHPCPRVACYCAFAAQSGGGWWLAGEGARCLSVRGTRTLFRDRAGRGSNRCPGFSPWTDASDVFASVAPSRLRIAWECQRDSRPLVFVVALARCFRSAPACFCLLSCWS